MKKVQENKYKEHESKIKADFELVETFTHLLDSKFQIPGTKFRFGIDPLINLIPFVGDIVGFAMSTTLVIIMSKYGASPKVIIKMLLNVLLDTIIGGVPVLGKVGDFFYKANEKNFALLKAHYFEGKHYGTGIGIIITILAVFFLIIFIIFWMIYQIFSWLFEEIGSIF